MIRRLFGRKKNKLTKHERYVLRLYRKHGGLVGKQQFFTDKSGTSFRDGVSIRVYVNGQSFYTVIPADILVEEVAKHL